MGVASGAELEWVGPLRGGAMGRRDLPGDGWAWPLGWGLSGWSYWGQGLTEPWAVLVGLSSPAFMGRCEWGRPQSTSQADN